MRYVVFNLTPVDFQPGTRFWNDDDNEPIGEPGWYYWFCEPGCLPTCEWPDGPFDTPDDAIEHAEERSNQ